MSERPASDPKKPELKDLVIALSDIVECHDLGLQLGLPEPTLKLIDKHHDIKDHVRMMLSEWLQFDPEASWEKLATALSKLGQNTVAANVRREFVSITLPAEQKTKKSQAMTETVLRKIKSRFSLLVIEVQKSMVSRKIDASIVQQFLLNFFEGDCDIPEDAGHSKIFNLVTKARLWRYDHYGPLEELAESFLPENDPVRAQVTEYKSQLNGFYATTSIIDFIKLNELEDREEIPNRAFSPKKYNGHYQKLTVELRLNRDMSEVTLGYVDNLWTLLMKEFRLPPLTAVIDKIVEGSIRITWLILPHIVEKIKETYFKSVGFFQQHNIISIDLYGDGDGDDGITLYHEEAVVTGSTPLFRASFAGNIDKVKDLLEGGANVNEANDNALGLTPLMGASWTGQANITELMLRHKANVDDQDKNGQSALHWASLYDSAATASVLLEHGAQVDILDDNEFTPLMAGCLYGSAATARVLLEHGANVDQCNENINGMSALMLASGGGWKETVAVLLEYRPRMNLASTYDWTALACAAHYGYAQVARLLLENGATMDFEVKVWKRLLRRASERGFSEVMSVLLEYRAPVNAIVNDDDDMTALCVACANGQAETAQVLLHHGATIDFQNLSGQSAVHLASMGGHTETLKVLMEKAAQLDLQDQDGWTPLMIAAKQGELAIVKILLEGGAAADIESKSGLTALKVALSEGHQDVCDILLQHAQQGPKVTSPEREGSESSDEEEAKAKLAEEQRKSDVDAEAQQQGTNDDGQRLLAEDTPQERRESEKEKDGETNRQQQETNTELTQAQRAEVRSIGERIWEQAKRIFLREVAKKEEAAQMREERLGTSEYIIAPTEQRSRRRGYLNHLVSRIWLSRRRVGTAPATEHN